MAERHRLALSAGFFSPIIWIGRLSKDGKRFLDGKEDVTDMAIRSVAAYALQHFGGHVLAEYSDYDVEVRVTRKEPSRD